MKVEEELKELKDYRLRVFIKGVGERHSIDIDARTIPIKNRVGRRVGVFYIDFDEVRLDIGQDLLDDMWEEMTWFVSPERVREVMSEYFEKY